MVYVVERYLPGLSRSDLLRGLSRLERFGEPADEESAVRYLGSTIVLGDEACFCQFEGPTAAAVAEANERVGLPFDRIVPAVTVMPERRSSMSASTPIPATVHIRRSRLLGLIGLVAALAAATTWVVLAFAFDNGTSGAAPSLQTNWASSLPSAAQDARRVPSIMSLTPAQLAAGALGTGYQLPSAKNGPTLESVLSSMSPQTRRYTEAIMALTFAQLAAGAGGQP